MISNAREAHKQNKVWVDLKINGGDCHLSSGAYVGGKYAIKGPFTPEEAMVIVCAAGRKTPREIHDYMVAEGMVTDPPRQLVIRDNEGKVVFAGFGKADPPGAPYVAEESTPDASELGPCSEVLLPVHAVCVRRKHEGHHWTTTRKPTKKDVDWLRNFDGATAVGMLRGEWRAFNRLYEKGFVSKVLDAVTGRLKRVKATKRGKALLAGEDVR